MCKRILIFEWFFYIFQLTCIWSWWQSVRYHSKSAIQNIERPCCSDTVFYEYYDFALIFTYNIRYKNLMILNIHWYINPPTRLLAACKSPKPCLASKRFLCPFFFLQSYSLPQSDQGKVWSANRPFGHVPDDTWAKLWHFIDRYLSVLRP